MGPESGDFSDPRLFVALYPPSEIIAPVAKFQKRLRELIPESWIRWTAVDQIHVTLRFLGRVNRGLLPDVEKALKRICTKENAFEIRAEGMGCFPGMRRPAIIWIGIADVGKALSMFKDHMDDALSCIGKEDPKAFHPHMTIGRVKTEKLSELRKLSALLEKLKLEELTAWLIKEVHLVESRISSDGATHETLQKFRLQNS
jgi:RNA 2',3'-cyclic 3'-phosphodiesterase